MSATSAGEQSTGSGKGKGKGKSKKGKGKKIELNAEEKILQRQMQEAHAAWQNGTKACNIRSVCICATIGPLAF